MTDVVEKKGLDVDPSKQAPSMEGAGMPPEYKAAFDKVLAENKSMKTKLDHLDQRVSKQDQADYEATSKYYTELIAKAESPADVDKLIQERDRALADIAPPTSTQKEVSPDLQEAANQLQTAYPQIFKPQNADEKGLQAWAAGRCDELEAEGKSSAEVLRLVKSELDSKQSAAVDETTTAVATPTGYDFANSRGASNNYRVADSKVTTNGMTADQKQAFSDFVEMGVYSDDAAGKQKYIDGLNLAAEEEAARWG